MALDIYKLTVEDYKILRAGGTIVKGDKTYILDNDAVYVTTNIDGTVDVLTTKVGDLDKSITDTNLDLQKERERASAAETTITELLDGQKTTIEGLDGRVTELTTVSSGLEARVSDAEGNITTLTETSQGLQIDVNDAKGQAAHAVATAEGLGIKVSDLEGNLSKVEQTAENIKSEVDDVQGNVSKLEQRADSIEATVKTQSEWIADEGVSKEEAAQIVRDNEGSYKGTYTSADALKTITDAKANDYAQVTSTDEYGNKTITRYRYNGTNWTAEEVLSSTNFTASQWSAINSGIDLEKSTLIATHSEQISTITQEAGKIETRVADIEKDYLVHEDLGNYSTTSTVETMISQTKESIELEASKTYETKTDIADNYYSKTETDGQITVSATEITHAVESKYYTKESAEGLAEALRGEISVTNAEVAAKVSKTQGTEATGFGWNLTDHDWTLSAKGKTESDPDITVFSVDNTGTVNIGGDVHIAGYVTTGEALSRTYSEFGVSNSSTVAPTAWSETSPTWEKDKFIWERTVNRFGVEGHYTYKYGDPVCIQGAKGEDGASISIKPSKEQCVNLNDAYVETNGHLMILTALNPKTFADAGEFRGPKGDTGEKGDKGDKGDTGASICTLDIFNDFDSVPCSSTGEIKSDYNWESQTTHTVKCYIGTTPLNFTVSDTVPTITAKGVVVVFKAKDVTFAGTIETSLVSEYSAYITNLLADTGNVSYSLYIDGTEIATAKFEASKLYAGSAGGKGEPGEDAVDYWLTVDTNKIKKDKDGNILPTTINYSIYKQVGSKAAEKYNGRSVYTFETAAGTTTVEKTTADVSFNVSDITGNNITITLYNADKTVKYDSETIPVIEDGVDGADGPQGPKGDTGAEGPQGPKGEKGEQGKSVYTITIDNDFDTVPCSSDWVIPSTYDWVGQTSHSIRAYLGSEPIEFIVKKTAPTSGTDCVVVCEYSSYAITLVNDSAFDTKLSVFNAHASNLLSSQAEVVYTLYIGTTRVDSCNFKMSKLPAGADGQDAVDHYIQIAGIKQIKKTKDNVIEPTAVTINFMKQIGNSAPQLTDKCYWEIDYNNATQVTGTTNTRVLNVTEVRTDIEIRMFSEKNGNILDYESIPLIADGVDGKEGPQGPVGPKGLDGKSISVKATADDCVNIGDGYIDVNGHLQILDALDPKHFVDAGEIKGPKGDSVYTVSISNDFDSVPCNSDGSAKVGYDWTTKTSHEIRVYFGVLQMNFKVASNTSGLKDDDTLTLVYNVNNVDYVLDSDVTSAVSTCTAHSTGFTEKTGITPGYVQYDLYLGKQQIATSKFEQSRAIAGTDGEDGDDAVDFWIVPNINQIKKSKTGAVSPANIIFNFYQQLGSGTPIAYDGYYEYTVNGQSTVSGHGTSVTINTSAEMTTGITITLYSDSTKAIKYDSETVPVMIDGTDGTPGTPGTPGKDGNPGKDGVSITGVIEYYQAGSSNTVVPTGVWETSPAGTNAKISAERRYLWNYEQINYSEGSPTTTTPGVIGVYGDKGDKGDQGIQGLQGDKGDQGIQGEQGPSGQTTYFHIKYSEHSAPTPEEMTETPSTYIGTYVDFIATDSTDPSKYTWTQFKGSQGDKGDQGIPGQNGADGQTSYLHIAYANSADGSEGFDVADATNKLFIGQYTDFNSADSQDYTKYKWSRMKGEKGDQGERGLQGIQGDRGEQGIPGTPGANGQTTYFHIKYSAVENPTDADLTENVSTYIGTYVDFDAADSTHASSYKWARFEGAQGPQGEQGIQGIKGDDGETYYLHLAYANSADGTVDFSTTVATNKLYIGQYTDTDSQDSETPSRYKWSRIKGEDGNGISSIVEYYLATNASNVTKDTAGWTTTVQSVSADKKFLWNYETINYTNGSTAETDPCIIGSWGRDGSTGRGITSVITEYTCTESGSEPSRLAEWWEAPPAYNANKPVYWIRNRVTYDNGDVAYTDPAKDQGLNDSFIMINGKNRTTYSNTQPSSPKQGDIWFDTANSLLKQYTGSTWEDVGDRVVAKSVNALEITASKIDVVDANSSDKHLFTASSKDHTVKIGGFNVTENALAFGATHLEYTAGVTAAKTYIGCDGWSITGTSDAHAYCTEINPSIVDIIGNSNQSGLSSLNALRMRIRQDGFYINNFFGNGEGKQAVQVEYNPLPGRFVINVKKNYAEDGVIKQTTGDVLVQCPVNCSDPVSCNGLTVSTAPTNFNSNIVLKKDVTYGTSLPTPSEEGQLFFLISN